jgi:hypothetical protein
MLTYARSTTLAAVDGLAVRELDHLHDKRQQFYQCAPRPYHCRRTVLSGPDIRRATSFAGGERTLGRASLRNKPLAHYLEELAAVRGATLEALAARDDTWLERTVAPAPRINAHWAWFHVLEDEVNHRGQIRWLRARLPR